jgi:hypothetical protein
MSSIICEFCNTKFNSISSLKYHKETAKYCLKIQEKNLDNIHYQYKCSDCEKSFLSRKHLDRHVDSCPKKNDEDLKKIEKELFEKEKEFNEYKHKKEQEFNEYKYKIEQEFNEYKHKKEQEFNEHKYKIETQLIEYKLLLSEKEKHISKLEELNEKANQTIADIAKQPKTSMNTTNIKGNQNIQNILCDYKTYEEYTDRDRIISIARTNDMEQYFWNGQKGIAKFCVDHIAKTKDGKMIICCTDPSRKRFKSINENNEVGEDIDARNFTKKIAEPIKEACKEVFDNIQRNIEYQINSDQQEHDSSFLSIKRGMAHEKYIEIRNIDDNNNNSEYRKEISILLNV